MHTLASSTVRLEKFADDSLVIVTGSDSALATGDQIFYSEALGHFFFPLTNQQFHKATGFV